MALLHAIKLPDLDKLDTLQRLDRFRKWRSLDERRFCLCCSEIITGHDVQVIGGTRGIGPLRIICPTESCPAIPMDWILPTDEILDRHRSVSGRNLTYNPTGLPPDCGDSLSSDVSTSRYD